MPNKETHYQEDPKENKRKKKSGPAKSQAKKAKAADTTTTGQKTDPNAELSSKLKAIMDSKEGDRAVELGSILSQHSYQQIFKLKFVYEYKANPDYEKSKISHSKCNILSYAACLSAADLVIKILEIYPTFLQAKGIDNKDLNLKASSPLYFAMEHGSAETVKVLIEKGYPTNLVNTSRNNILHALADSRQETQEKLALLPVDLIKNLSNQPNNSGLPPFHETLANLNLSLAAGFLEKGANPNNFYIKRGGSAPTHTSSFEILLSETNLSTLRHQYGTMGKKFLEKNQSIEDFIKLLITHGAKLTVDTNSASIPIIDTLETYFYGHQKSWKNHPNINPTLVQYAVEALKTVRVIDELKIDNITEALEGFKKIHLVDKKGKPIESVALKDEVLIGILKERLNKNIYEQVKESNLSQEEYYSLLQDSASKILALKDEDTKEFFLNILPIIKQEAEEVPNSMAEQRAMEQMQPIAEGIMETLEGIHGSLSGTGMEND